MISTTVMQFSNITRRSSQPTPNHQVSDSDSPDSQLPVNTVEPRRINAEEMDGSRSAYWAKQLTLHLAEVSTYFSNKATVSVKQETQSVISVQ